LSRHLGWRVAAVLLVLGAAGWLAVTRPARLGLDLRGGTQIVLETRDGPDRRVDDDTVARTLEVLRRRVDQLGVTEPTLQRSGDRRVIVELPGVYDPEQAVEVIGRTAQLVFHPVLGVAESTQEAPTTTRPAAEDELVLADETGRLPFNGETYQAAHTGLIDQTTFERAQAVMAERGESWHARAANAGDYLLTSLLRCQRCGHGFVGTAAHGKAGIYRYYTCYARQRHGTARCDQERIPADPLEEAIVAEVLAALDDGELFAEAARRARHAWEAAHPGRQAELAGVDAALAERRAAVDRYLRAFEVGRLPEAICADRLRDLEREIAGLAARKAALESLGAQAPVLPADGDLQQLRDRIALAVAHAAPQQLKLLLAAVVDRITVESRACIQPYFTAPGVRTLGASRRRTGIEPA
jgi:Recombinase zinc beta ribbon domain/SecD/SecF GG Motif